MADVTLFGVIERIRCTETSVLVTLLERRLGYKRKDGVSVSDGVLSYRVFFKSSMRKYITDYFSSGNLVKVKGTLLPYCLGKGNEIKDGYTIFGQTMEFGVYPRLNLDVEKKMSVDTTAGVMQPDVDDFMDDGF